MSRVACRDFQRGSCRYGSLCKFSHQLQGRQNQTQAPQAQEHRCNDPRACKERIKDDFTNERPTYWRLTCYAHWKHLPNDISGDTSFEELRAMAYESAQQGMPLAQIASREAFMFRSKEAEFDALRRNPYKGPASKEGGGSNTFQPATPPGNTIFGKFVPSNSPIAQMFKPEANAGGFGHGPVVSPPQFHQQASPPLAQFPPVFNVAPFPQNFQPFPFLPPPSPVPDLGFSPPPPPPPLSPSPFPGFVNPSANAQVPLQQSPGLPSPAAGSMLPEASATWSGEHWELGQIPEDEPPVAVR